MMTQAPITLGLEDGWSLELATDFLALRKDSTDETHIIPREEAPVRIERLGLRLSRPLFHAHIPALRKFKLREEQARIFDNWLGSDFSVELRTHLKRFMGRSIFLGMMYVAFNWPQWPYLVLGSILIIQGILYRSHPSHWLFLLYASFWLGIASLSANHIVSEQGAGGLQWLNAVLGFAFFFMSLGYFQKFRDIFNEPQ